MTDTDKDLLERAARAAGYTLKFGEVYMLGDDEIDCTDQPYVVSGHPDEADWYWDPLHDDGDALRLAVKLGMNIGNRADRSIEAWAVSDQDGGVYRGVEQKREDPFVATRRAIVRAAAALGASPSCPTESADS